MELDHLWFSVPKNWLEEGKGVQHSFEHKRLSSQIEAIERASTHRKQLNENYKDERRKANEYETAIDSDKASVVPLHKDNPIHSDKKDYIEEIFISEECLRNVLKIIFEENTS